MKNIFCCPDCKEPLSLKKDSAACVNCDRRFYFSKEVWQLLPKRLEVNKIKEDKLHLFPDSDVFKYNKQVWRCLVDLAPHLLRFEKEIIPMIEGKKRILEIACGNGWASALIKLAYPETEVYASDVSPNGLRLKATKLSQIMGAEVDFFVAADVEHLPFADDSFDFVFIIASLHHFPDIVESLKEIKRVLRKRGSFLGIDGAMPFWCQRLIFGKQREIKRAIKYGILEQLITYRQWKKIATKAGMSEESVASYVNPSYIQSAPNNPDEARILRFSALRTLFFGGIIGHLPKLLVEFLCLLDLFPVGIVINFTK